MSTTLTLATTATTANMSNMSNMSKTDLENKLNSLSYDQIKELEGKMIKDKTLQKARKGTSRTKDAIINRIIRSITKGSASADRMINIPIPEPSVSQKNTVRLPKVWKFESETYIDEYEKVKKYLSSRKGKMQVGDIIMPKQFYRGYGTFIVDEDKTLEVPITFLNGEIMLPPWVFENGMKNGFTFEQLRAAYSEADSFSLVVYPYALQGSSLKYLKNGIIKSLRTYGPESGEDVIIKKGDGYYYDDLDGSLYMSDLFPHVRI
jgi:hypothetical protein